MRAHNTTTSMAPEAVSSEETTWVKAPGTTDTCTPYFHRSSSTRVLCICGLVFSWLCAILCIIIGGLAGGRAWEISLCWTPAKDIIVLAQNIIITICNESLGYIHSVSLRWALQREGRLEFNSNLRLFSTSRSWGPNAWYSNLIMTCGVIVTYGSSAITFQLFSSGDCLAYNLLGNGVIVLGCGLAAQACIATWALCYERDWPTWSSNALDVAAACLEPEQHSLCHRPGRSIRNVHAFSDPVNPDHPSHYQPCAFRGHRQIRYVLYALWTAAVLCCVWFAVLVGCTVREFTPQILRSPQIWQLIPPMYPTAPFLPLFDDQGTGDHFSGRDFAWLFVLLCALQSLVTFTLHAAELLVNCTRDEDLWRRASHSRGGRRTSNALVVLLTSYQSLALFCLKPFAHWVYSLSFLMDIYTNLVLRAADSLPGHYDPVVGRSRLFARIPAVQRCSACGIWAFANAGGLDRRLARTKGSNVLG